ncbi:MAG TPA: phytanoyl-CoA dioxygenase family protein [Pseudomonadales bacterium]
MLPVPVDQRCEFLSPEWIREAGAFLEATVPTRPELAASRFSLCEAFDDAPPSLAPERGHRLAWHFAIDRGRAEAGCGERLDVDLRVTGRYQAALGFAQLVHAAGPEAVARGQRELRHLWGDDALRLHGTLPQDPAVQRLLTDLHDHMAARTIENPHFAHRVGQMGLERQVEQLTELGYAVIENAITPETADALCELTAREVRRHHPLTTNGLMMRDRLFEEVVQHSRVTTLAQSAVGQNMILGAMSGTWKKPGPGAIPLHADYPLVREPYPEFGLIAVAVWALQDWDSGAVGPTWVLPGSHRHRRPPRRDEPLDGAVPILMPKGSALVISHGIWHWQGDRTAPGARVAMHVTYNRVFVRPLDDFSAVDDAYLARNPPAFSTLMGRDDPFGKSSYQGHDAKRFAYAGRFTQT